MGTKNKPGRWDCYTTAAADEPMFVLLARDPLAPFAVESWADDAEQSGVDPAKIAEARVCAAAMRAYVAPVGLVITVGSPPLVAILRNLACALEDFNARDVKLADGTVLQVGSDVTIAALREAASREDGGVYPAAPTPPLQHDFRIGTSVPRVGVAVFVRRGGAILFGRRVGDRGRGTWGLPGGAVEPGEAPVAAALRELREETGLIVDRDHLDVFMAHAWDYAVLPSGEPWVTLLFIADVAGDAEPRVIEPDKIGEWAWRLRADGLPKPLFEPLAWAAVDEVAFWGALVVSQLSAPQRAVLKTLCDGSVTATDIAYRFASQLSAPQRAMLKTLCDDGGAYAGALDGRLDALVHHDPPLVVREDHVFMVTEVGRRVRAYLGA